MASHKLSIASSLDLSGKIFCAQSPVGIEMIDHVILSFIVYFRKFFIASAPALLAFAINEGSTSFNKSGFVDLMDSTAAPSSAYISCNFNFHYGHSMINSVESC